MAPPTMNARALWLAWTLAACAGTLLLFFSTLTLGSLLHVQGGAFTEATGVTGTQLDAAVGTLVVSAVLVVALLVASFAVLLRKSASARAAAAGAGFAYACVAASFVHTGLLLLVQGLVLVSDAHWAGELEAAPAAWYGTDTAAYVATYVLSFIGAAVYVGVGVGLVAVRPRRTFDAAVDEVAVRLRGELPMSHLPQAGASPRNEPSQRAPAGYKDSARSGRAVGGGTWGAAA